MGATNVHAQVAAEIDFSVIENTDEKYRPNQTPGSAAIRSQQSSESTQQGMTSPGGVPGALSNQPPLNPTAPITTTPAGQAKPGTPAAQAEQLRIAEASAAAARTPGGGSARKDGTTNYELDRTIRHVQQGAGGVKRLSVAVVVNHRSSVDAQGKRTVKALSATELEQVNNLVKEAMGFSAERGDSLNVVNSPFASDTIDVVELPLWRQPDNIELAKTIGKYLLMTILALYLWFAVLRPLLRKHLQPAQPVAPTAPLAGAEETALPESAAQVQAQVEAHERQTHRHEDNVKYAQEAADSDPRMVAMLIKHWMTEK
jgi:flagellar M-ring protein FliF